MDDIVERLRARAMRLDWATVPTHELEQAADEIERERKAHMALAASYHDATEEITRLRGCVRFFASVIRCGEPWTDTCEREYQCALSQKEGD